MDFDDTPSSITVYNMLWVNDSAHMQATDEDGKHWDVSLLVGPYFGGKHWFAETVYRRVVLEGRPMVLTSRYDSQADEWYTQAGNYSIHSKDLHFSEM